MLKLYRRHLPLCPHRKKGQSYSLCACPIWAYGAVRGQTMRRSMGTADGAEANRLKEIMEHGPAAEPASATIAWAAEKFIASRKGDNLKQSTLDSYTQTLEHLTVWMGGHRMVNTVDVALLDEYRASREIAPGTWRKELETLRAFFKWCNVRGWGGRDVVTGLFQNPAVELRKPQTEELKTLPLEAADVLALIDATNDLASDDPGETPYIRKRARAVIYTLLYSGLRISDVAALRRGALSPGGHLTLRVLKTGVRQQVLLHPRAAAALRELPARHPDYFFWSGNGDIITCVKNMRRTIDRLGKLAAVDVHPHRFRDTFAVELLTNGADIRTVQQLLGHKSVKTTEKHYAHFVVAHQQILDTAAATLDFESGTRQPLVHLVGNRRRNA